MHWNSRYQSSNKTDQKYAFLTNMHQFVLIATESEGSINIIPSECQSDLGRMIAQITLTLLSCWWRDTWDMIPIFGGFHYHHDHWIEETKIIFRNTFNFKHFFSCSMPMQMKQIRWNKFQLIKYWSHRLCTWAREQIIIKIIILLVGTSANEWKSNRFPKVISNITKMVVNNIAKNFQSIHIQLS